MTYDPAAAQQPPPYPIEPEPLLVGYPPPAWTSPPGPNPLGGSPPAPGSPAGFSPSLVRYGPLSPMPQGPVEFHQMLRGPRRRWWRPLVALLVVVVIGLPLMLFAFAPVVLAGLVAGISDPLQWAGREILRIDDLGPAGFFYVNLSLIVLIPTTGWSVWIVHRIRPRYLASVRGGIRWGWLLRCVAVVVPIWAIYLGLSALLDPARSPRPGHWGLLLVIVVCLTPFQAAGEEYLFRGWILQNVGSWFRHPRVGLGVGLTVSVVTFAAAHGSRDIWVFGSLAVFALTAGLATWRTGGLEAGIAIHAVNNIGVFCTVILLGGWQGAFVSASSTSTPLVFSVDVLVHAVALALILWQAKKAGIQRRYLPADDPVAVTTRPLTPAIPV